MGNFEMLGRGGIDNRQIYLLELDESGELPDGLDLHGEHFSCALVLDASAMPTEAVCALTHPLLHLGMVYACAWGPDCERVHDIIDEDIVGGGPEVPRFSGIMTTWHADAPLTELFWFFLNLTSPMEEFARSCGASLVICQHASPWLSSARELLKKALAAPPEPAGCGRR